MVGPLWVMQPRCPHHKKIRCDSGLTRGGNKEREGGLLNSPIRGKFVEKLKVNSKEACAENPEQQHIPAQTPRH